MTQIKLRRDTAANFTSKNPVLGQGEPAYETDTKKMKIGDGTTAYNDLAYFDAGGGSTIPTIFPYAQKLTIDNLNDMTSNGLWYYDAYKGSAPTNAPRTDNDCYFLEVLRYQEDSAPYGPLNRTLQRLTYLYSSTINKTYIRSGIVSGYTQWTPWVELGGSGNSSTKSRIIDTDAVVVLPWGTSYTCPADGVCVFGCWMDTYAGTAMCPLDHDDETNYIIRYAHATSGRVYAYNSIVVNKGQTIMCISKGTTGDHYFKFYPYKEIEVS